MTPMITLTVGIPAHNEASTIRGLLTSILSQRLDSPYQLTQIIVACDGCTDQTSAIVRSMRQLDSRIHLIDDGLRLGKSGRLNQFYRLVKTDIFVTFDADTVLAHSRVLQALAQEFADPAVMLVGGNDTPAPAHNLIEKTGAVWVSAWYEMRHRLNAGDTVHNHKGCASAGRMPFLQTLQIPGDLYSDDDFLYFSAVSGGHRFRFAESAVVYYHIPSSFHEYMTQTTRFLGLKHRIAAHFGDWVYAHYHVPISAKFRGLLLTLLREPLYLPLAIILQVLERCLRPIYQENYQGVSWQEIRSSKK